MSHKYFAVNKVRQVTDVVPFTKDEFIDLIRSSRPKEIYNSYWSSKMPFIVLCRYCENGVDVYCNALTNKTPEYKTYEELYGFLIKQGLQWCYIIEDYRSAYINATIEQLAEIGIDENIAGKDVRVYDIDRYVGMYPPCSRIVVGARDYIFPTRWLIFAESIK